MAEVKYFLSSVLTFPVSDAIVESRGLTFPVSDAIVESRGSVIQTLEKDKVAFKVSDLSFTSDYIKRM